MDLKLFFKLIAEILVMVNAFLASLGITYFEGITSEAIYIAVSIVGAVIAFGYAVWKNHNFTAAAKSAQKVLDGIKKGE